MLSRRLLPWLHVETSKSIFFFPWIHGNIKSLAFQRLQAFQSSRFAFPEDLFIFPHVPPLSLFDSLKRNSSGFLHPRLFPSSGSFIIPSLGAKPNFKIVSALAGSVPVSPAVCQLSPSDTHLWGEACTKQSLHCHVQPNSEAWSSQTLRFLGRRCHSNYLAIMSAEIIVKLCMQLVVFHVRGYSIEPKVSCWGQEMRPIQWWLQSCQ